MAESHRFGNERVIQFRLDCRGPRAHAKHVSFMGPISWESLSREQFDESAHATHNSVEWSLLRCAGPGQGRRIFENPYEARRARPAKKQIEIWKAYMSPGAWGPRPRPRGVWSASNDWNFVSIAVPRLKCCNFNANTIQTTVSTPHPPGILLCVAIETHRCKPWVSPNGMGQRFVVGTHMGPPMCLLGPPGAKFDGATKLFLHRSLPN